MKSQSTKISKIVRRSIKVAIEAARMYEEATGGKRKLGITGEVGEVMVCDLLGLRLVLDPRSEGYDALDKNGKRVQIKSRRSESGGLPKSVGRISRFSQHPFDYALLAILKENYEVYEIWRADYHELKPLIEKQKNRNPALSSFRSVAICVFPKSSKKPKARRRKTASSREFLIPPKKATESIRGKVVRKWLKAGNPAWDLARTITECEQTDSALASKNLNRAPKFREHRLAQQKQLVRLWVQGCKFPWL